MKLRPTDIEDRLQSHPGWVFTDGALERSFPFQAFMDGLAFVQAVAQLAEEQQHHPDVWLRWGQVQLRVWSHDAKGITERDFRLIAAIDAL